MKAKGSMGKLKFEWEVRSISCTLHLCTVVRVCACQCLLALSVFGLWPGGPCPLQPHGCCCCWLWLCSWFVGYWLLLRVRVQVRVGVGVGVDRGEMHSNITQRN